MCCQVQTNFVLYKIPSPEASSRVQLPSPKARVHFSLGTGALKYKISAQIHHELFTNTSPVHFLVPAVAHLNDIRGRPDTGGMAPGGTKSALGSVPPSRLQSACGRDRAVARVASPPGVEAAGHGSSALELVIFPPGTVVPCCLVSAWMDSKRLPLTRGATKGLQRARCLRSLGGFR